MKKRIKGFTLVELIAVIVILSIILIIGVPSLISNIKEKKQVASKQVYELLKSAARNYEIDYDIKKRQSLPISDLCERYIGCPIIDPATNEEIWGYISIGDGEYKFLSEIKFDWKLFGGTTTQEFQHTYIPYTSILLLDPVKENYEFSHWQIVKGNSEIDDDRKILTFGDTDTIIWAVWKTYPTLTVKLGEGATTSQIFETSYKSGTTIELQKPARTGYIFAGWTVTSTNSEEELNSIVSGNMLTIGDVDTTLTANWKEGTYSCANVIDGTAPYSFTYTGNCEVVDDGNDNWRVKFLTSGTFIPNIDTLIDAFLVGGGGGSSSRAGGGGGYTATYKKISITANNGYNIVVGAGGEPGSNGKASSAFGKSVNGGINGKFTKAGDGGSGGGTGADGTNGNGGKGGSNGENGSKGSGGLRTPGTGQSKTTREFGESTGTLYAGGGGGGGSGGGVGGAGGSGGGGAGGDSPLYNMPGSNGKENTGGGAGGGGNGKDGTGSGNTASGGSGIVVIRNARG